MKYVFREQVEKYRLKEGIGYAGNQKTGIGKYQKVDLQLLCQFQLCLTYILVKVRDLFPCYLVWWYMVNRVVLRRASSQETSVFPLIRISMP